jgi:hypothetical protein
MIDRRVVVGGVVVVLVGTWMVSAATDRMYSAPKKEREATIASLRERIGKYDEAFAAAPGVRREIEDFVARTLGGDQQTVDHRLRSRLNRLAERLGIAGATVGTVGVSTVDSPARREFRGSSLRHLREEIDFVELEGWISAETTFELAVRLVDEIEAEPWLKRIRQLRLDPKDNGERFTVTVRLTTLFMPGREPLDVPAAEYDPTRLARVEALLAANPFRVPPPEAKPVVAAAAPPAPAPKPPSFGWADWMVTGVAETPAGPEVWVRNRASGETRRLVIGESLHTATLTSVAGDRAEFRIEEKQFAIQVGQRMNDRSARN